MKAVICEYHPWDTVFRVGDHHYARAFLNDDWDVLWINHPVSPLHSLNRANRERLRLARSGARKHPDGPTEIIPLTHLPFLKAPFLGSRWTLEHSHQFFKPPLRDILASVGFLDADLVWITDPVLHPVADAIQARAVAVRIADDNTRFSRMPRALRWAENKLCKRADVVFATSFPLAERLQAGYGAKVHLLRNGVEFGHFQGDFARPEEYEDISGPIAIYVGAIEDWFSIEWVQALARARQDITVVLIGGASTDLSPVERLRNVRFLGPRKYDLIPRFLCHAHCGIIPFRRTPLVESVSPLKLFDFLAAGLPVVSTRWRELEHLQCPALLEENSQGFVRSVGQVVDEDWKAKRGAVFRDFARANSWEARYHSALGALQKFLSP